MRSIWKKFSLIALRARLKVPSRNSTHAYTKRKIR